MVMTAVKNNPAQIGIIEINWICHKGTDIAKELGTNVTADEQATCSSACKGASKNPFKDASRSTLAKMFAAFGNKLTAQHMVHAQRLLDTGVLNKLVRKAEQAKAKMLVRKAEHAKAKKVRREERALQALKALQPV